MDFGTGYIDFGARQYNPSLRRWMTPDPLSENYYGISPYAFCNNNPVNLVDPDGRKILGASKHDAEKVVSDLHNIFSDDIFDSFRQLIKLDHRRKRQVAKISEEDINQVLRGKHDNGRCVTTGHEVFGHGRSLALGRGYESQHVDAIQMENLILRVMRINYINNGLNHGPGTVIANPSDIPSYR